VLHDVDGKGYDLAWPRVDREAHGGRTLLAEIAAFPDGKHDDQVDALS
jgi:hypothetical protein